MAKTIDESAGESAPRRIETHEVVPSAPLAVRVLPHVALLALAIGLYVMAGNFVYIPLQGQLGPAFWPQVLSAVLGLAALARLVSELRAGNKPRVKVKVHEEGVEDEDAPLSWSWLAVGAALAVGYVPATIYLGFPLATAVFMFSFIWLGGERRWFVAPLAVVTALGFAWIFLKAVYVSLPTGVGIFDRLTVDLYNLIGIY
jgi:putative tricarboxylic transport membrane protein